MRSTTARPAMFLGWGRPCRRGDAAWIFCGGQAAFAASVLPLRRSRGGGVAGAPSEARRGCAAGTSPGVQAPARSAAGAKSSAPGRSRKKEVRRPAGQRTAPDGTRRDQFAVIVCNCSITPGSTKTQGWSAAIGTPNTCAISGCSGGIARNRHQHGIAQAVRGRRRPQDASAQGTCSP